MREFKDYFDNVPCLETERFILVPFAREDMEDYFAILRDERVQKYLGGGVPLFDKEPHITNWLNNVNDKFVVNVKIKTFRINIFNNKLNKFVESNTLSFFVKSRNRPRILTFVFLYFFV